MPHGKERDHRTNRRSLGGFGRFRPLFSRCRRCCRTGGDIRGNIPGIPPRRRGCSRSGPCSWGNRCANLLESRPVSVRISAQEITREEYSERKITYQIAVDRRLVGLAGTTAGDHVQELLGRREGKLRAVFLLQNPLVY